MCNDLIKSCNEEITGYKVVAYNKEDGRYYSLFTGNKYPVNGKIPIWVSQKRRITSFFIKDILPGTKKEHDYLMQAKKPSHFGWKREMIGRTAAFRWRKDAFSMLYDIKHRRSKLYEKFKIVVVEVKLTNNLMSGSYRDKTVYAGKRMEILEEVKE